MPIVLGPLCLIESRPLTSDRSTSAKIVLAQSISEVGPAEVDIAEVGTAEVDTAKVGTAEVGTG